MYIPLEEFTARLPYSYYFTLRPFAVYGWTDGGANEEATNQFTNGLKAQKRTDL